MQCGVAVAASVVSVAAQEKRWPSKAERKLAQKAERNRLISAAREAKKEVTRCRLRIAELESSSSNRSDMEESDGAFGSVVSLVTDRLSCVAPILVAQALNVDPPKDGQLRRSVALHAPLVPDAPPISRLNGAELRHIQRQAKPTVAEGIATRLSALDERMATLEAYLINQFTELEIRVANLEHAPCDAAAATSWWDRKHDGLPGQAGHPA